MLTRSLALLAVLVAAASARRIGPRGQRAHPGGGQDPDDLRRRQPAVHATANPLDALDSASQAGEFYYHLRLTSFGEYVDQIGRYPESLTDGTGWVFKVNGVSPPVGAKDVVLKDGDSVLWYFAQFGPAGGPQTLQLTKGKARNCYRVVAQDDRGKGTAATGAVLHVDGRTVRGEGGRRVRRPSTQGLVRATLAGAVRSNALR